MTSQLDAQSVFSTLKTIRYNQPLIHNITNLVVMNSSANALLALGASPVMAHALREVRDMVTISSALVANIGTLSADWVEAMDLAMQQARDSHKPIVLDPVGAGATPYRTQVTRRLLASNPVTVVRGNASEIAALVSDESTTKGVDATQPSQNAQEAARILVKQYDCTVVVSGAVDTICDRHQTLHIANGHPLMAKVTGMGCNTSAFIAACLSVTSPPPIAAATAMAVAGIAGEIAAEKAAGPGSLAVHFLDVLYNLDEADIRQRLHCY
ncbi:hydroxyethylthiazole kinase [Geitlerinema sp. PCC 9228]|jgi:hydroxyethylthiazole kinase|uniref:hydroxyethylthiazole kinase n=1 Tax=Geitlerinema sp. PCC 9228 TaxID=111611 RepID=UPI0008F9B505|nr:hydroxyethylthiazole kinase [Geitlerinema sp. PCC 9228]